VRDNGRDDRRRSERRADAGEPAVGLNTDQRRVALDLGTEVGAVTLLLRNRVRHGNGGELGNFHPRLFLMANSEWRIVRRSSSFLFATRYSLFAKFLPPPS